jgi:hypothetical protein
VNEFQGPTPSNNEKYLNHCLTPPLYFKTFKIVELAFALGENISKEQAQSYVDELDTNKDGKVSFEEFFSWWQKKDIATEQHKPTGLGVLKARLQSQPLMRR